MTDFTMQFRRPRHSSIRGISIVEMLVASVLVALIFLGVSASMGTMVRSGLGAKSQTQASQICQQTISELKSRPYHRITVSTSTATDPNFPSLVYDTSSQEEVTLGPITYYRRQLVQKVQESGGVMIPVPWNTPDTGIRQIQAYVTWKEGKQWKKSVLSSLSENPEHVRYEKKFTGVVQTTSAAPLNGATVIVMEDPSRNGVTTNGLYSIAVQPGSYVLRASKPGYISKSQGPFDPAVTPTPPAFSLTKNIRGAITGTVYYRSAMISEFCLEADDQYYVELYNPGDVPQIDLTVSLIRFNGSDNAGNFTPTKFTIPPRRYFLLASALYNGAHPGVANGVIALSPTFKINSGDAVHINLTKFDYPNNPSLGRSVDVFTAGPGLAAFFSYQGIFITTPAISPAGGLLPGESWERKANPTSTAASMGPGGADEFAGNGFDVNSAPDDFVHHTAGPGACIPHNASMTETHWAGAIRRVPNARVASNDGFSSFAVTDANGDYAIPNVAEGQWNVSVSTLMPFHSSTSLNRPVKGTTTVPSPILTDGAEITGVDIYLDQPLGDFFLAGNVKSGTTNLPGITVTAGGNRTVTNAMGNYFFLMPVPPDGLTNLHIEFNKTEVNPLYQSGMAGLITSVTSGDSQTQNWDLSSGGSVLGRVTSNGFDPLPYVTVSAYEGAVEKASGITDPNGYFLIPDLAVNKTYAVIPQLDQGQTAAPSPVSVSPDSANRDVWSATFTVAGSMGRIAGRMVDGASGRPLAAGVLVYASTATISGGPPVINEALRSGAVQYYGAMSKSDGTYSLQVRGSAAPYKLYAWYTTWDNGVASTQKQQATGLSVAAGGSVAQDFSW